jgi:hypothetical protein
MPSRALLALVALAALGLSAWAAVVGPWPPDGTPPSVACSSCDARHQNVNGLRAAQMQEPPP